jgi:toxin ParE1/3/4
MLAVRLTTAAERDLLDVWIFSFERWGEEQADRYLDVLDRAIRSLSASPWRGTMRDYVRAGYRVLFVNQHAIYYLVEAAGIRVVRVLHRQMDPEHHF